MNSCNTTTYMGDKINLLHSGHCEISLNGALITCHNLATAKFYVRQKLENSMKVKTKDNIRNTRYGAAYTSAEIALMTITTLAGLSEEILGILTEDAGVKSISSGTLSLNRRKMDNLLFALSNRDITVEEFREAIRGELDRTNAKFDSIVI